MIVELAREGVWTIDAEGRTTFANRAMAEMLDTTVAEMLEGSMFDYMDDEARADAETSLDRRNTDKTEEHDFRLTTKRGRTVWTRMNTSPITDHSGWYRGAIALVTDVTERRALEQRLAADARQDSLTGVGNRTALFEALNAKLAGGRLVAALYIDLDGFKNVNDDYGHAVGDEVLRTVAARLGGAVRTGDIVARVGGDEFVVVSRRARGPRRGAAARQPHPRRARAPDHVRGDPRSRWAPASASRSRARPTPTPTRCSPTPTARSTAPSAPAAAASS